MDKMSTFFKDHIGILIVFAIVIIVLALTSGSIQNQVVNVRIGPPSDTTPIELEEDKKIISPEGYEVIWSQDQLANQPADPLERYK